MRIITQHEQDDDDFNVPESEIKKMGLNELRTLYANCEAHAQSMLDEVDDIRCTIGLFLEKAEFCAKRIEEIEKKIKE